MVSVNIMWVLLYCFKMCTASTNSYQYMKLVSEMHNHEKTKKNGVMD